MGTIGEYVTDPGWWFSAVLVGLLVSVAGVYVARWWDEFLGRFSRRQRETNAVKKAEFERKVDQLINDNDALTQYKLDQLLDGVSVIIWILAIVSIMLASNSVWDGVITSNLEAVIVIALSLLILLASIVMLAGMIIISGRHRILHVVRARQDNGRGSSEES